MAAWITPASPETAGPAEKAYFEKYSVSKKGTIELNNAVVYKCVEMNAWDMDDEVKAKVGGRYADLLETAISVTNKSVNCARYFTGLLKERYGIDLAGDPDYRARFDEKDAAVWDYGVQIASDMHGMTPELKKRLLDLFTQEQIVVLTGMAAIMSADNIFESIMEID